MKSGDDHHHHSDGHVHGHAHHAHAGGDLGVLVIVLAVTVSFMVVELLAGHVFNSLALTADAWHMVSDAGSLVLALFAIVLARRPRSARKTFGYRRLEVLAALANGALLGVAAVLIVREAWERWWTPQPVRGLEVAGVAFVGIVLNVINATVLARRSQINVNVRAALAHALGDLVGSAAACAAGLIVHWTHFVRADPLFSVMVSMLLVWGAWRIISETAHILMEGTPEGIDPRQIEEAIARVPGVGSVHDLHVWSIAAGEPAVTAHVVLAEGAYHGEHVARSICETLERRFDVRHATIQPEPRPPGIVQLGRSQASPPRPV